MVVTRQFISNLIKPRMIKLSIKFILNTILGKEMPLIYHDRYILEQQIIPYFVSREEFKKVLFVGCGTYTKHYIKWFKNKDYWTIDVNPLKKIVGAQQHIVGSLADLSLHFKKNELDLILCNGVFGWGLNEREEVEKAFGACYESLRDGGVLVIGWDDVPERKPFPLESCHSLNQFKPYLFPPLSTTLYVNPTDETDQHKYNFYIK